MSRKVNKRKRPDKDIHLLKDRRIDEAALDVDTMRRLSKFYNKGVISKLGFIVARGKESDVYIASAGTSEIVTGNENIILKFFRIGSSSFLNMQDYIIGDPRFKRRYSGKFAIIRVWCKKEFGNLQIAYDNGINVPKPYMFDYNILAMELIGSGDQIAKKLKDVLLDYESANKILNQIIVDIKKLYNAKLVHADLSEYNILLKDKTPYIIDMGQAVSTRHPNARAFLKRDVINVLNYFHKEYNINFDAESIYEDIIHQRDKK